LFCSFFCFFFKQYNLNVFAVREVSLEVSNGAKQAGSTTAQLAQDVFAGSKPMNATSSASLSLFSASVSGLLSVVQATWTGAGKTLRG
jgi:hypothetical protein